MGYSYKTGESGATNGGGIPWGPIGSVAGTLVDAWSQSQANKANAQNVQKQLDFQKEQSETAYQRAAKDLAAAGFNPAYATQAGGNSSQSGAAAQAQPTMRDTGQKIATALQTANIAKEGNLLDMQAQKAAMEAESTRADIAIKQPEAVWGNIVANRTLYGNVKNLELGARGQTATNYPQRYEADIARTRAGTTAALSSATAAEAQAALAGSVKRLNEQQYMPDAVMGKPLQWTNATAKAFDTMTKGFRIFR